MWTDSSSALPLAPSAILLFQKHYDGFKEKPCAGYQWFRPDQDVTAQIETVKLACEGKTIRCIFSDQEQAGRYNIPHVELLRCCSE